MTNFRNGCGMALMRAVILHALLGLQFYRAASAQDSYPVFVSSAKELAVALSTYRVQNIALNGTISLNSATWKPIGGTVTIVDRAVKIGTAPNAAERAVLDLGQIVDAIMVGENGILTLYNMSLVNAAPRNIPHTDTHARYKLSPFGPWPSLTILPNATIVLNQTYNTYDSEAAFKNCTEFQSVFSSYANSWTPPAKLMYQGNDTLVVPGTYTHSTHILDLVINETVGYATIVTVNNSIVCVPNAPLPGAAAGPASADGVNATSAGVAPGGGGGGVTWWIIAIAVIASVAAVAVGVLTAFLVRRKGRANAKLEEDPEGLLKGGSLPPGTRGPGRLTPKGSSSTHSRSLPGGYSGDIDSMHAGDFEAEDDDRLSELPGSSRGNKSLSNLLNLPETLRKRSSCMVDSLELGTPLGRGSYGKVYKGKWKGVTVAVKIVEHNAETEGELIQLRESLLSSSIVHPNVIATYKVRTVRVVDEAVVADSANDGGGHISRSMVMSSDTAGTTNSLKGPEIDGGSKDMRETWMLLEYADRGNLDRALVQKKFCNEQGFLDMDAITRCLIDIAAGMDYLHSLGVLHGDLKGANVLLKSTNDDPRGYTCKLADFGLSRVLETHATHVSTKTYGTLAYMPAELLQDGRMSRAADVYSFAMIMWELFACKRLYEGHIASQVFFKVLMGFRPNIPENMPKGFRSLMVQCWDVDADKRPPFEEVLRQLQALHEGLQAMADAEQVQAATPSQSLGSENAPASPGWDQRLVSVANSAAPSSAAATDPSRFWNTAQTGPNSAAAPRDLASKQSLQKLDSGLIPEVFGTRDSLQESSFELQATSEQKSPSQAALAAQAMAAQVLAERSRSAIGVEEFQRPGQTTEAAAASGPGSADADQPALLLNRQRSGLGRGGKRPGVLAWRPPQASHSSTDIPKSAFQQGTYPPAGGSSPTALVHALSAEYTANLSAMQQWSSSESGPCQSPTSAPERRSVAPEPSGKAAAATASPAEVEMVGTANDDRDGSANSGLHVPDVVSKWFKTTSFHKPNPFQQKSQESAKPDSAFADNMPLERTRKPRASDMERKGSSGFADGFVDNMPLESTRKSKVIDTGRKASGFSDSMTLESSRKPRGSDLDGKGSGFADNMPLESTRKPRGADIERKGSGFIDNMPLESSRKPRGGMERKGSGFSDSMSLESLRKSPREADAERKDSGFADNMPLESTRKQR